MNRNILVTGVGGPAGINTARLLREENGVEVFGCDIDEKSSGRFFIDTFMISPRADDDSYESWIRETVTKYNIDILIPTVHEELPILREFSDDLPCEVIISDIEAIKVGDDKKVAYEWADINLPDNVIKWSLLSDWTLDWSKDENQFIKPRQGRGARGCKVLSKAELTWLKENTEESDSQIVMECVKGTEWTVDAYVGKNGDVVYAVVRERSGLSGGISIKGKTVKNKAVIDVTKKMLSSLSCKGPVCIQFKADSEGVPRFIEINPRLSGGLMISVHAGINPIKNILDEHKGEILKEQDWDEITALGYIDFKKLEK